jgi:hypothetical protein
VIVFFSGRACDVDKDSIWIRCLGNHASQCRPGEVSYSNKCYSLVIPSEEAPVNNETVGYSQSEAIKHCQTKGGHLLDITSQVSTNSRRGAIGCNILDFAHRNFV